MHEVGRLHGVPPAGQQGDTRDSRRRSARSSRRSPRGSGGSSRDRPARSMINGLNQLGTAAGAGDVRATGPIASRPASCRRRRRGRRASSATSSSPSGTGPIPKAYLHDEVSTDRRNPTRQRQRPDLRGARAERRLPARARSGAPHGQPGHADGPRSEHAADGADDAAAVAVLGRRSRSGPARNNVHNPMLDEQGRVWLTSAVRPPDNPDYCKEGSSHPSAKLFPMTSAGRHLAMYDPKTEEAHAHRHVLRHAPLMFAEDANHTLWTSGGGQVVGWLNTKMFDETGDEEKSQGWTALIIDTNGNGKRDAYVEPDQPVRSDRRTSDIARRLLRRRRPRRTARSGDRCWASPAPSSG